MAQVLQRLPSNCKVPSSNPSIATDKTKPTLKILVWLDHCGVQPGAILSPKQHWVMSADIWAVMTADRNVMMITIMM
jgi:hypothetical protein